MEEGGDDSIVHKQNAHRHHPFKYQIGKQREEREKENTSQSYTLPEFRHIIFV